jgi:hypothetical protein
LHFVATWPHQPAPRITTRYVLLELEPGKLSNNDRGITVLGYIAVAFFLAVTPSILVTPLEHSCNTLGTPLELHRCNTPATPFVKFLQHPSQHPWNTLATPLQYFCVTLGTTLHHPCNTLATFLQHPSNTLVIPWEHSWNNLVTPFEHPCNTLATPWDPIAVPFFLAVNPHSFSPQWALISSQFYQLYSH